MKNTLIAAAMMTVCYAGGAVALEATASSKQQQTMSTVETRLETRDAILTAAISKINKEQEAMLYCMRTNKFYKPKDSTADAKGCVGVTVVTTNQNLTKSLPNVAFDSYPGASKGKKGWSGTHSETIDLKPFINEGAKAVTVSGVLAGFTGGCTNVTGNIDMAVADVNTSISANEFRCHYDSSPNRSSYFIWSYSGSSKKLTMTAKMSQNNSKMTSARLGTVKAKYTVTKTSLKVGDGK